MLNAQLKEQYFHPKLLLQILTGQEAAESMLALEYLNFANQIPSVSAQLIRQVCVCVCARARVYVCCYTLATN